MTAHHAPDSSGVAIVPISIDVSAAEPVTSASTSAAWSPSSTITRADSKAAASREAASSPWISSAKAARAFFGLQ